MKTQFLNFLRDEEGATAIEYGLIAGLIAVAIIAALGFLSDGLEDLFESIGGRLTDAGEAVAAE